MSAAPGNPGIATCATCQPIDPADHAAVVGFCRAERVTLVVVGPEAPLVAGLCDALRNAGIAVFGPGAAAAQLEASKSFTKRLCARMGIPTAQSLTASTGAAAITALDAFGLPVVVKADGLAAGKGVTVAATRAEAEAAIAELFERGPATAVIEEFLVGEEVSLFVLVDRDTIVGFGSAQDHKRVGDGDTGPNTGGMGAYSPAAILTREIEARALREIVAPTIAGLAADGIDYCGVLFAGLMLTATGPRLIEYNVRFGDPEAEVLMMRFEGDLAALLNAVATGRLAAAPIPRFSPAAALCVVLAASGYPGPPQTGGSIAGIDAAEAGGVRVFQAATASTPAGLVAAGGRVLAVGATGTTIGDAQVAAYRGVAAIDFPTGFFRHDIGWRAVARERDRPGGARDARQMPVADDS